MRIRRAIGTSLAVLGLAAGGRGEELPALPEKSLANYYHAALPESVEEHALSRFLFGGTPKLELRLAYERADLDDATNLQAANELSLRTRLSYRSGTLADSSFFLQLHHVWNPVDDFATPGGDGDLGHDTIADPDGTRLHQAYVDFGMIPATRVRVGVQEINLGDQRLIGAVDWRQNGQSFGGVRVTNTAVPRLTLDGAYVTEVYDILLHIDPDIADLILLHAEYAFDAALNAAAFVYLLDADADARDSATYGMRLHGRTRPVVYDATVALQTDYADGDHSASLLQGFVGSASLPVNVGVGYVRLSGGGGEDNFDTLFGTAHKFNGWADLFLASNGGGLSGGLEEVYVQATTQVWATDLIVRYHRFATTDTMANGFAGDYGDELDVEAVRKLYRNLTGRIGVAHYREGDDKALNPTADKQVFWVRLEYSF
jgi:hypothetical protein